MLVLSDEYAEQDLIGHSVYRDGLVQVIRSVHSRGSFTIGIFGSWGSGKTTILQQVRTSLDDTRGEQKEPTLTVWFNPWQFTADEHLIIPFFHTLIASLEAVTADSNLKKWHHLVQPFLEKIAHVPLALLYGMEGDFKIPLLLNARFIPSKTIDYQQAQEERVDKAVQEAGGAVTEAARKYESTYYNLIKILREAASTLGLKIVVFVDDLDRCLPEKAVQLLEGLKVLLDLPNFVFVVGVAREVIERGLQIRYQSLYETEKYGASHFLEEDYLDKIIQFPFSLPAAAPKDLKENILRPHLRELQGTEPFIDLIYESLGSNPRTLKRYLNAISFTAYLAEKRIFDNEDFHPELLIKVSLIGYIFPALFRQLERHPAHLVRLQKIVQKLEPEKPPAGQSRQEEPHSQTQDLLKTGLPIIDQWLDFRSLEKLRPILRIRENSNGSSDITVRGFFDEQTVVKYVRLLETSLDSEVHAHSQDQPLPTLSLAEELIGRLVSVPAGRFTMGNERTGKVEVEITKAFQMDKYPMTQSLYQKVTGTNPSHFQGEDLPVDGISWFDAIQFCNRLSSLSGFEEVYEIQDKEVEIHLDRNGYRLPTEAEWEYACRCGGSDDRHGELEEVSWYSKNSGKQTRGVGQKDANSWGLYDMLGNVWEWCNDWYSKGYSGPTRRDPAGPREGSHRIQRGGSWANFSTNIRASYRTREDPSIRDDNQGFRVILPSTEKP
ncbi:MAG: SUMF1/EgtB/PvdO family nonheme iron enzyme [Deltaproteobacteria bacterium]|nr:SUMF1/EgtB/PvdO family nonheme iron enzyme [Deltaproteobacteria bacterium]